MEKRMKSREDMARAIAKRFRREPESDWQKVDITTWNMEDNLEEVSELFEKAVVYCASEALKYAVGYDAPARLSEDFELSITVPLGADDYSGPEWKVSITDIVRSEFEWALNMEDHEEDREESIRRIRAWRNSMLKLVTEIDEVLTRQKDAA
jgi:hypothetical protein